MYPGIKALHIISMVAWFAGLFYIFRLYVYHVRDKAVVGLSRTFVEMERKLLRYIMFPAALATVASGFGMVILSPLWLSQRWFHFKLALVLALFAYHALAWWTGARFAKGEFVFSERSCRMINEVPTLILVGVVVLVVTKPFG